MIPLAVPASVALISGRSVILITIIDQFSAAPVVIPSWPIAQFAFISGVKFIFITVID